MSIKIKTNKNIFILCIMKKGTIEAKQWAEKMKRLREKRTKKTKMNGTGNFLQIIAELNHLN